MYYWDFYINPFVHLVPSFSSCQKNVLLGLDGQIREIENTPVSVVVRRMYYWDVIDNELRNPLTSFSSCQKNVLLGLMTDGLTDNGIPSFSSCQKNVLLGPKRGDYNTLLTLFQQLLEECTIGTR